MKCGPGDENGIGCEAGVAAKRTGGWAGEKDWRSGLGLWLCVGRGGEGVVGGWSGAKSVSQEVPAVHRKEGVPQQS